MLRLHFPITQTFKVYLDPPSMIMTVLAPSMIMTVLAVLNCGDHNFSCVGRGVLQCLLFPMF